MRCVESLWHFSSRHAAHAAPRLARHSEIQRNGARMIPPATEYVRAKSIEEAVRELRDKGPEARLLAGGHSLIPMMKLRMAAPQWLVDISAIAELQGVSVQGHELRLGATTTHAVIEHHADVAKILPLVSEIARCIADPLVRNRGTIGGALSNAD